MKSTERCLIEGWTGIGNGVAGSNSSSSGNGGSSSSGGSSIKGKVIGKGKKNRVVFGYDVLLQV